MNILSSENVFWCSSDCPPINSYSMGLLGFSGLPFCCVPFCLLCPFLHLALWANHAFQCFSNRIMTVHCGALFEIEILFLNWPVLYHSIPSVWTDIFFLRLPHGFLQGPLQIMTRRINPPKTEHDHVFQPDSQIQNDFRFIKFPNLFLGNVFSWTCLELFQLLTQLKSDSLWHFQSRQIFPSVGG